MLALPWSLPTQTQASPAHDTAPAHAFDLSAQTARWRLFSSPSQVSRRDQKGRSHIQTWGLQLWRPPTTQTPVGCLPPSTWGSSWQAGPQAAHVDAGMGPVPSAVGTGTQTQHRLQAGTGRTRETHRRGHSGPAKILSAARDRNQRHTFS